MTNSYQGSEARDIFNVLMRGGLLLFPFLLWQIVEVLVLPEDTFTFRVWEAALATPYRYPGSYYPNIHVRKEKEFGDRYRTGNPGEVESKPVEWFVDRFGWRNRPEVEQRPHYDAVLLGDSNIVGSFLDQKDTLSEVMAARSGKTVYSYAVGHDHISLFFNDPRMREKNPDLLVVETRVGTWETNNSYLLNFYQRDDGTLDIIDRHEEFENIFYAKHRNFAVEKIHSRLLKQPMFYWLQSELALAFHVNDLQSQGVIRGHPADITVASSGWAPTNWVVSGAIPEPLGGVSGDGWKVRSTSPNGFWHTEKFLAAHKDGKITVSFSARSSLSPSRHLMYIFENGSYRSIGEFAASKQWRNYEIDVGTSPGSALEFQIDQADNWQWLEVRDFKIVNARSAVEPSGAPIEIAMSAWSGAGAACSGKTIDACRQWATSPNGYIQTPVLPIPNSTGVRFTFEARTDQPTRAYSDVYLFEDSTYRKVSQYRFGPTWKRYELLIPVDPAKAVKIQLDFPRDVSSLAIRNAQVTPAARPIL